MDSQPKLEIAQEVSREAILLCMALDLEAESLYFAGSDSVIHKAPLADLESPTETWEGHQGYVMGLAKVGSQVISGAYDRRLIWRNASTGDVTREFRAHDKWIRGVEGSPDGKWVASVADDMVCRVWDAETAALKWELVGHAKETPTHYPSMLFACAFSADSARLATADKLGHVIVWDLASGKKIAEMDSPLMYTWDPVQRRHSIGGIRSIAFAPDGERVVVGGVDQIKNIDGLGSLARLEYFNATTGESVQDFPGEEFKGLTESLDFSTSGKWVIAAGGDHKGFVFVHNTETNKQEVGLASPMHVHEFARFGSEMIAVGHGKIVRWDLSLPDESADVS